MYDLNVKRNCIDCDYLFLPNLRWATDTPQYIVPMHEHLKKRLGKVGMLLHGWDDTEDKAFRSLYDEWEVMRHPVLIIGNAKLYQKALLTFPVGKVVSYWEILADYGLPPAPHTHSKHFKPVPVFDPWPFHDDEHIQMFIRDILLMSNYEADESAAPQYKKCTDETAYKNTFIKEVEQKSNPVITYCNNGRDFLAAANIPVIHLLDLIFSNTDEKIQKRQPLSDLEKARNIEIVKAEIAAN